MFQFMRKSEKDKAEKKPVKSNSTTSSDKGSSFTKKVKDKLSPDDLHRLDEIRRSFKLGKAKKEKQKLPSGIIADYRSMNENFMNPPVQSVTMPSLRGYGDSLEGVGYGVSVSVTHSDSSESSLSSKSLTLPVPPIPTYLPPEIPAKPPRAPAATASSTRSPPPVPARPSTSRYSTDYSTTDIASNQAYSPSRPPTSASTSSFTPSFVTPPQSPNHNLVSASKFYVEPELDLGDQVNPKPTIKHGYYRIVTVERLPTGDFGFSVRKSSITTKIGTIESILFVEPSQAHGVRDFGDGFLLPGDRLTAVNNIRSDSKSRDEVIDMIKSSQNTVSLKVQSASHWIENIQKINHEQEENGYLPKDSNWIWLVHKSGFMKGQLVERIDDAGRCKVKVETGQTFVICEDDVEPFNPPSMDLLPYLWNLNMINESSVIHILRNRYHSSLPCTIVTNNMMLFLSNNARPNLETQHLLKSVVQPITLSKLLPNVYSCARQAFRGMIINKRHQSIVVYGQSNVQTKREIVRETIKYLSESKGIKLDKVVTLPGSTITVPSFWERLQALTALVEFFCSSDDTQYEKSTVMYNLEFDLGGRIIGINSQIFLLDVERVYEAPYFGIIQALHDLSTCPVDLLTPYPQLKQLKKDLKLSETDTESSGSKPVSFYISEIACSTDPEKNLFQISNILSAMVILGLGETFTKSIWSVFGAVYHFGHVVGTVSDALQNNSRGGSSKNIESGQQHFKSACALLGLSLENVEKTLIMEDNDVSRIRNVLGFSLGLFIETVNSLFTTVNKSNSVGFRNVQCLSVNVIQMGASTSNNAARFGDLSSNYLNDRVSKLLKEVNFDRLEKLYQNENVTYESRSDSTTNGESESFKEEYFMNHYDSLPLLDSFPSATNNSSKTKGFLYYLDDAKEPARCLEKFEGEFYGENQYKNLYSVDFRNTSLTIAHSNGTHIVEYDVKKILHHVDIISASKFTNVLIQDSKKDNINCMFLKTSNSVIGVCISAAAPDGSLRRSASIRRNYTTTWQKKSATVNIKIQTDYLTDILGRTQIQAIKCLNPFTRADGDLDVPMLRAQIRSDNITDLIRFYKSSYPIYMIQTEFVRKFKCLSSPAMSEDGFNVQQRVADVFDQQDLPASSFKLGTSLVFMKPWVLNELEEKQTLKLNPIFVSLQSVCRGSLTRNHLVNLKVRDVAIKCIQKNVRKLLAVRDWSWWKLYQQISPLLKVQSSHEKLQTTQDELASIKLRYEKVEAERNLLKLENEKLEIRVNELSAELTEEQATASASAEKIEQEMLEKQQIENQHSNLKSRYQSLENEKQQLELDLTYSISDVNGESTPDEFNDNSVYKQRWERCKRELEMTKQRLKQKDQDHLDQIMIMKKSLEKKCSDAWEESEEQKQIVAQLKRRIQKLSSELSDVKCLHQEEASRSALLEKKQRRFDSELSTLSMQVEKEKLNKDKIIRERDAAVIQKDSLFNEMQALKMEIQLKDSKLHNLEMELEEASQSGGSSEQVNALRKAKNDFQMKAKELEEELDDLAGQVQTLESTKLRLEMQMEQMRKENKREVQQREEEIEDLRSSAHKKVKALECQLEAEHEERTQILRSKQELERKVFDLEELSSNQSASHEHISRLKKELKRTKALLKDAQATMEQSKNDVLSKGMLRQLRHQLEDSESQRSRLTRSKQKVDEELTDTLIQIEELTRRCSEAENEKNYLLREKTNIQMQFEEGEENLAEIMKKYKAAVEQLSVDQITITDQCIQVSELEAATSSLKETIAELTAKLETLEGDNASQQIQKRFQLKVRELETRLELETTTKTRLENQVTRLKEHLEKFTEDMKNGQTREYTAVDKLKKSERQLRECKEETIRLSQRDTEAQARRANLEKQIENADLEISTLKGDLKLAMQRIEDLTTVIRECDETTDDDDSSTESVGSNNDSSILSDAQFELDNIKLCRNNGDESVA